MAHATDPDEALSALHAENLHLKDTVAAMRTTLEAMLFEKNAAVQQAAASSHDEVANLKAAVSAQREAMENLRAEKDRLIQEAVARGKSENRELQVAVSSLRDRMEQALMDAREGFSKERRGYEDQLAQLRRTVVALREALEAKGRT